MAKTVTNSRATSEYASREHLEDLVVDLADDGQQVPPGVLQVLQLRGEEPVALLQRRELLQRERVDLAQQREVLLRPARPALLGGPLVGHRGWRRDVLAALPRRLVLRHLRGRGGHRHVRPVLGDQVVRAEAVVGEHLLGELLEPQAVLGAEHLVAVDGVGELLHQRGEPADHEARLAELALAGVAGGRGGVPLLGGGRAATRRSARTPSPPPRRPARRSRAPRSRAARAAAARLRAWRSADGLTAQGFGPARDRPRPLLGRAQRQAGVDLRGSGGLDGFGGGVADLGVGLVVHRLVLGHRELLLRGLQGEQGVGAAGLDLVAAGAQALGLGRGGPHGLLVGAEPGRGARAALLGGRLLALRRLDVGLARRLLGAGAVERGPQPGDLLLHLREGGRGVVDGGLDVERAAAAPGAAGRPVRPEDVPIGGDGGEPGRDHPPRRRPVGDEHHALQQRPHRPRPAPLPPPRRRRVPRTPRQRPAHRPPARTGGPDAGSAPRMIASGRGSGHFWPRSGSAGRPIARRTGQAGGGGGRRARRTDQGRPGPRRPTGGRRGPRRRRRGRPPRGRRPARPAPRRPRCGPRPPPRPAPTPCPARPRPRRLPPSRRGGPARPTTPPPAPASAPAAARPPAPARRARPPARARPRARPRCACRAPPARCRPRRGPRAPRGRPPGPLRRRRCAPALRRARRTAARSPPPWPRRRCAGPRPGPRASRARRGDRRARGRRPGARVRPRPACVRAPCAPR